MSVNKQIEPEYNIPVTSPGVDDAFAKLFSMDSEWSLEERFDRLMQAMTASAFYLMDRQRRTGKKIGDAEREFQEEAMAQLNLISKCWATARKYGRVPKETAVPRNEFEGNLLGRIIDMKGMVGDLVRTVTVPKKEVPSG